MFPKRYINLETKKPSHGMQLFIIAGAFSLFNLSHANYVQE